MFTYIFFKFKYDFIFKILILKFICYIFSYIALFEALTQTFYKQSTVPITHLLSAKLEHHLYQLIDFLFWGIIFQTALLFPYSNSKLLRQYQPTFIKAHFLVMVFKEKAQEEDKENIVCLV